MGNVISSALSQHRVYVAVPLICLGAASYTLYGALSWDPLDASTPATLVHLASLALNLGSYTWQFTLARHCITSSLTADQSADVERHLVCRLYLVNTVTSTLCLTTFLLRHPWWELDDGQEFLQVYLLAAGVLSNSTNTLVLNPWVTQLQESLASIEKDEQLTSQEKRVQSDAWRAVNKRLGRARLARTLCGHLGFVASCGYLFCLATNVKEF